MKKDIIQLNNRHFVISMIINGEKVPAFSATTLSIPDTPKDNLDAIVDKLDISIDKFDMNVPLRYLVKILYLMATDKVNNTLSVIVDGGDWSGMWPLRVYMEPLLKMNISTVPSIIYTPTILDWSGSKLSKRMYVGNSAYREYLKEGLINYSEFYNQYGEIGFERLYNEINQWVLSPKKFIRDYTIEYIDAVLNDEKINFI